MLRLDGKVHKIIFGGLPSQQMHELDWAFIYTARRLRVGGRRHVILAHPKYELREMIDNLF